MIVLGKEETRAALPWAALIDAVGEIFAQGCVMPLRHHHEIAVPGEEAATLLLMPAWRPGDYVGVKMVSVFPGNYRRSLPSVSGSYLLSSGLTGELLAIFDGGELTARRTAAASALAARALARPDSTRMLMVGNGRLSLNLVTAHASQRPLEDIRIWGRDPAHAEGKAAEARAAGYNVHAVTDLKAAVRWADIISCATLADAALIRGAWLRPGTHLDLVGAFRPTMREVDDEAVSRSSVFVDTREGVLAEGGDLVQAIRSGSFMPDAIRADLADLVTGRHPGRRTCEEITLFKSVGAALEDLAAAMLAYRMVSAKTGSPSP